MARAQAGSATRAVTPSGDVPIRVMIIDDSIVARAVLSRILAAGDDIEIVAQVGSAREALTALRTVVADVILLDLNMPGVSGLEVLPALIAVGAGARVLVVSSVAGDGAEETLSALRLGAADTLLKPALGGAGGGFAIELLERLRRIAGLAAAPRCPPPCAAPRRAAEQGPAAEQGLPPVWSARPIACVAIGASTGGVNALARFFSEYPRACDAPILVTQHLPPAFMPYFAAQLAGMSGRPTRLAVDGMKLVPGTVLLAPGEASLSLARTRGIVHVKLVPQRSRSGCLPSVDPMFDAVARMFGDEAIGIVLSGMGRDGLVGARALRAACAEVLVQDEASSVVWGMPGVVSDAGLAAAALAPEMLARIVARRMGAH